MIETRPRARREAEFRDTSRREEQLGAVEVGSEDEVGCRAIAVLSARVGQLIRAFEAFPGFQGGIQLAAGDVNGDGRAEVIVSAPSVPGGYYQVFDAAAGKPLTPLLTSYPGYSGTVYFAVGDVTGDGVGEILAAARIPGIGTVVDALDVQAGLCGVTSRRPMEWQLTRTKLPAWPQPT